MNLKKWDSLLDIQRRPEAPKVEFAREYVALLKRFAPPSSYPHLLDIGCESGVELETLTAEGYKVIGITMTTMSLIASSTIQLMDMHDQTFNPQSFDIAYACSTMEHSYAPWLACLETWVTLRDSGIFFVIVPQPTMYKVIEHPNLLSQDQWAFILEHTGFKLIHNAVHTILNVPLIVIVAQRAQPQDSIVQKVIDKLIKIRLEGR